jgi:hypothetical protein
MCLGNKRMFTLKKYDRITETFLKQNRNPQKSFVQTQDTLKMNVIGLWGTFLKVL